MQSNQILAQKIAQKTHDMFDKVYLKKLKTSYSSSSKYTVICSMGLIDKNNQFQIICLSNGTKSLPYDIYKNHKGKILKDTHAQILCIKAFRRWIVDQIQSQTSKYIIFDQIKSKFRLNTQQYKLFLYSSQKYCGDCSISQKDQQFSGGKPLKNFNSLVMSNEKYEKNILRTKPGRNDLPLNKRSLCLSCSDKLSLYNIIGIQGKNLFKLIKPVYINFLIINGYQCKTFVQKNQNELNISNGTNFVQRLACLLNKNKDLIMRKMLNIIIQSKQRPISKQFRLNIPQVYCLSSLKTYLPGQKQGIQVGYISNGKIQQWINGKTGLIEGSSLNNYMKKGKISNFCKLKLIQSFNYINNKKIDQQTFKYTAIKQRIKILFGVWTDNFK